MVDLTWIAGLMIVALSVAVGVWLQMRSRPIQRKIRRMLVWVAAGVTVVVIVTLAVGPDGPLSEAVLSTALLEAIALSLVAAS